MIKYFKNLLRGNVMGSVLAVTSGKGGVGKSSVSVGLAVAYCRMGKTVLLVDMDEGLRCLDLMLGIDKSTVFDLADVLEKKEIDDALYTTELAENLYLIPAPSKVGLIEKNAFAEFAVLVSGKFDVVIFDFPAGINVGLYKALPKNTLFITVAVPDLISIRDASALGAVLAENKLTARLVINRFVYKQSCKYKFKNIDGIIDSACIRLLGIVPESEEILMLSLKHKIKSKGNTIKAFTRIARRIEGEQLLLPKLKKI
jgi:septum site-determining protein MinD